MMVLRSQSPNLITMGGHSFERRRQLSANVPSLPQKDIFPLFSSFFDQSTQALLVYLSNPNPLLHETFVVTVRSEIMIPLA
jgi:hypothetical protein